MIRIVHLYYDLLNLYGENGNIRALKKFIESTNNKVTIDFVSLNDNYDFSKADIIYVGSGTEENILIASEDIKRFKSELTKFISDNKLFIATGNSNILFGKTYTTLNKDVINTLNLFDYESMETKFRTVGEQVYLKDDLKIIGFLNHQVVFKNYPSNLFKVVSGNGYHPHKNKEGLNYKNFYGTLLIGPLLVRNPIFLQMLLKNINIDIDTQNSYELKSYQEYLNNFIDN